MNPDIDLDELFEKTKKINYSSPVRNFAEYGGVDTFSNEAYNRRGRKKSKLWKILIGGLLVGLPLGYYFFHGQKSSLSKLKPLAVSAEKSSIKGRFRRTVRWKNHILDTEKKFRIERGLLAGIVMQESYGDPTQIDLEYNGECGLMMLDVDYSKKYGLKVRTPPIFSKETEGVFLYNLVKKTQKDYLKLAREDARFSVPKSLKAGAEILYNFYDKTKNWDEAIKRYNSRNNLRHLSDKDYLLNVRKFQNYYNKRNK